MIIAEGKPNQTYFRIKSGTATVLKMKDGVNAVLSEMGAGKNFGEMSVFDKNGLATASVLSGPAGVELYAIDVNQLLSIFKSELGMAKRFSHSLSIYLADSIDQPCWKVLCITRSQTCHPPEAPTFWKQGNPLCSFQCCLRSYR